MGKLYVSFRCLFFVTLLFLSCFAFAQSSQKDSLDSRGYDNDFLKSPYKQPLPSIVLFKTGPFRRDQKEISKQNTVIKLRSENCTIAIQRYKLNHNAIFEFGIGKLNKDSIFYTCLNKSKANYFYLKRSCIIKFMGYSRYRKSMEFYFELTTKKGRLIFSTGSDPRSSIVKYDYFFYE